MEPSVARRNILTRIRAAQGRPAAPTASERDAAAGYLARHPEGPRPMIPDGLVGRFIASVPGAHGPSRVHVIVEGDL